jgi:hypothetical protein
VSPHFHRQPRVDDALCVPGRTAAMVGAVCGPAEGPRLETAGERFRHAPPAGSAYPPAQPYRPAGGGGGIPGEWARPHGPAEDDSEGITARVLARWMFAGAVVVLILGVAIGFSRHGCAPHRAGVTQQHGGGQ